MELLSDRINACRLSEKEFTSSFNECHIEQFESNYYNVSSLLRQIENDPEYRGDAHIDEIKGSMHSYRNLVLSNARNPDSIENLWHSESDAISRPGGLADSSDQIRRSAMAKGAAINDYSGMDYVFDIKRNENDFIITHNRSHLGAIYDAEEKLIRWSGNDPEIKSSIETYNINLEILAMLYQKRIAVEEMSCITIQSVQGNVDELNDREYASFKTALRDSSMALTGLVLLTLILSVAVTLFVTRSISSPLHSLAASSASIAGGNLNSKIDISGNDEITDLARNFEVMVKSLKDRIEFNDTVLKSIEDAHIICNTGGNIIYFNRAAERLTGYTQAEAAGKNYCELLGITPDSGMPFTGNYTCIKRKCGKDIDVSCNATGLKDSGGNEIGMMLLIHDMTAERTAFREIARLNDFNENIVDSVKAILIVVSPGLDIVRWNQYAADTYGVSEDKIGGTPLFDAIPSLDSQEFRSWLSEVFAGHTYLLNKEYEAWDAKETRYYTISIASLHEGNSLVIMNDVTENTRLRKQLEEKNVQLASKNEEIESYLYTMSHDLRAPLISLQGYLSSLNEEISSELNESTSFYMIRMNKNLSMMDTLINDLLELSRVGRISQPYEKVNTGLLVADIVDGFQNRLNEKKIAVITQGDMPVITCEKNRISQLFTNLIDNAIKYIGDGTSPTIEVGCKDSGSEWLFHVKDNGIGIAPQYHSKLFKMFARVPGPETKKVSGTGIGLAIVKKVVETHGGRIWVDSQGSGGTTFYFTIPKTLEIDTDNTNKTDADMS